MVELLTKKNFYMWLSWENWSIYKYFLQKNPQKLVYNQIRLKTTSHLAHYLAIILKFFFLHSYLHSVTYMNLLLLFPAFHKCEKNTRWWNFCGKLKIKNFSMQKQDKIESTVFLAARDSVRIFLPSQIFAFFGFFPFHLSHSIARATVSRFFY